MSDNKANQIIDTVDTRLDGSTGDIYASTKLSLATKRLMASLKWHKGMIPVVSAINGRVIAVPDAYTASTLLKQQTASNAFSIKRSLEAIHSGKPLCEITAIQGDATKKIHFVGSDVYAEPKGNKKSDEEVVDTDALTTLAEKALGLNEEDVITQAELEQVGNAGVTKAEELLGLAGDIKKDAVKKRRRASIKDE